MTMYSIVPRREALCFAVAVALVVAVFLPGVSSIPLDEFYPFGAGAGDLSIAPTLDGSSPVITLRRAFPFFQRNYFTIVVSEYLGGQHFCIKIHRLAITLELKMYRHIRRGFTGTPHSIS